MITEVHFPRPARHAALTEFAQRQGDFAIVAAAVIADLEDREGPPRARSGSSSAAQARCRSWWTPRTWAASPRPPPPGTPPVSWPPPRSTRPRTGTASAAYRKKLAATLVERALTEAPARSMTWVGAPVARTQDRRMLLGRGKFTGDLARTGTLHAAFVRSPFAAATFGPIDTSPALARPGVAAAFTAADLGDPALLAVLERPEFVPTALPLLAIGQVRHVGEPVAVVLAEDPYLAEDAIELVDVDWSPQPVVASLDAATAPAAPQVHEHAPGNCLVDLTMFDDERLAAIFDEAPAVVTATLSSGRLAALPMEGRACLAEWDERDQQVVMHVSTQVPHQVRSAVAQAFGLAEQQVRVIAPDVGGGFGLKCVAGREEVTLAGIALRLRRPVRWVEDRQENLTASFHGHEQRYRVRAAFGQDGRILGLAADIECDVGAYSAFPFTCAVEPLMAATELPGIYKVPAYRARGRAIATHKAPTAPYRGVSRPQLVLVMERIMEKAARQLGLDPLAVRRRNMIGPGEFPYTSCNGITYDEGSYAESLDLAEKRVTEAGWPGERDRLRAAGRLAGIGYSCFSERTAYGTPTMSQRRMRMTPGYDTAAVRMDPSGEVIVTTGTCGHGQGHETTFAQIVADRLGVHPARSGSARATPTWPPTAGAPGAAARS